jgi:hypothetical protein
MRPHGGATSAGAAASNRREDADFCRRKKGRFRRWYGCGRPRLPDHARNRTSRRKACSGWRSSTRGSSLACATLTGCPPKQSTHSLFWKRNWWRRRTMHKNELDRLLAVLMRRDRVHTPGESSPRGTKATASSSGGGGYGAINTKAKAITSEPSATEGTATSSSSAGNAGHSTSTVAAEMGALSAELAGMQPHTGSQTINSNRRARQLANATHTGGLLQSIVGTFTHGLSGFLTHGFGVTSLVSGLVKLFGGGKSQPPPPLVHFALPPIRREEAGLLHGNQFVPITYGQNGFARSSAPASSGSGSSQSIAYGQQAAQLVDSHMDSQWFLDHSADIASAVKEAMLHSHSLNDVVADL